MVWPCKEAQCLVSARISIRTTCDCHRTWATWGFMQSLLKYIRLPVLSALAALSIGKLGGCILWINDHGNCILCKCVRRSTLNGSSQWACATFWSWRFVILALMWTFKFESKLKTPAKLAMICLTWLAWLLLCAAAYQVVMRTGCYMCARAAHVRRCL